MLKRFGCLLLLSSLMAAAAPWPAKGTMGLTCLPSPGMSIKLRGPGSLDLLYILGTSSALEPHKQIPVIVTACGSPIKCTNVKQATVTFEDLGEKAASGSYAIVLNDGDIETGTFKVTVAKPTLIFTCN